MEQGSINTLVLLTAISATTGAFMVLLFLIFQKRKNKLIEEKVQSELKHKQEQAEAKRHYQQQIVQTQIEIREETLKNISWELHDNIGQLMTLAKIQVQNAKDNPEKIEQVAKIIGDGLNELRMLSKIINPDVIKNLNLEEAVQLELERFNRLNFIHSTYKSEGDKHEVGDEAGLILFRIMQEFFSNTIKHSQASELEVVLKYTKHTLLISVKDNGKGFDTNKNTYTGIGLKNMKSRAALIGATLNITSVLDEGTQLHIVYNLNTMNNEI